jgi:hypothetical protein
MADIHAAWTGWAKFDWKAATWAGLIAGVIFMMMEMILVATVQGESMWGPPRMIAAIVMGEGVLPPPATFDAMIMMVAMIVHFVLSIIYAFILAWILARWEMSLAVALLVGGIFGLALYIINFYGVASVLFPWFAMARNWISWMSHIVYGIVLAGAYLGISRPAQWS